MFLDTALNNFNYLWCESGTRTRMRKGLTIPLPPVVARDCGFVDFLRKPFVSVCVSVFPHLIRFIAQEI